MTFAKALRARPLLIAALSLFMLYAAGLLYQMAWAPAVCCGLTWPQPDPAQAERLIAAKDPKGLDGAAQRKLALILLSARPGDSSAWLRLAFTDLAAYGGLNAEGRHALEMSYLTAPYSAHNAPYRVTFTLENWNAVSVQTQADCLKEIAIAKRDSQAWPDMRRRLAAIRNPAGRLAASAVTLN